MSIPNSTQYLSEDIGPTIVATGSLMIFFVTAFVGLRYYARYITNIPWGIEDALVPLAWLAEMGICVVGIIMVTKAGTGRHMDVIVRTDPGKITQHLKGILIIEILHPAAVAFPKLVVVLLMLRVLTNRHERNIAKVLVGLIFGTWFSFTIATLFQCTPLAFNWDKSIPSGRCFNLTLFASSSSVPNIITDLAVLVLPIRTVWGLKISIGRRVGLLLIFLTGSVGIVASIIRTIVFNSIDPVVDFTYNHTSLVNWSIIEPGMYLLAACSLSFKPLLKIVAKALHLQVLITHTKSVSGTQFIKKSSKPRDVQLDTLKTASSGGFTRLQEGKTGYSVRVDVGQAV